MQISNLKIWLSLQYHHIITYVKAFVLTGCCAALLVIGYLRFGIKSSFAMIVQCKQNAGNLLLGECIGVGTGGDRFLGSVSNQSGCWSRKCCHDVIG